MRLIVILLALALLMAPGISFAEHPGAPRAEHPGAPRAEHPGGGRMMGGQEMSHGMRQNMDMMNQMTGEMQQMMGQTHYTPAQQQQMRDMMNQMDRMKQQMSGQQNTQVEQQQRKQLQDMRQRLNSIKEHQH